MKISINIAAILLSIFIMQPSYAVNIPENPVYYLEYSVSGTGAEIRLNDIPILLIDTKGTTESVKPIPESIIDGENVLTVRTFPLDDYDNQYRDNAYIDAKITLNERDAPLNASSAVLQLHVQPAANKENVLSANKEQLGDSQPKLVEYSDQEILAERSVHIKSPYPRWAWQDGKTIEINQENYDSLLETYKEIYNALKQEDINLIHKTHKAAALEYAHAYDYDDVDDGYEIMNAGGYIDDEDWILGDINLILAKRKYHLVTFANGKLAQIVDHRHDPSLLTYLNKKVRMVSYQTFKFYKNQSGIWILIR